MSEISYSCLKSGLGDIYIIAEGSGISRIIFGEDNFDHFVKTLYDTELIEGGITEEMRRELKMYLEGKLTLFGTKFDIPEGTEFQRDVWKKLLDIPYGSVVTYKDLAERVGRPKAARAVGNAVGANPMPIVIPCHRVLAGNGLGGYSCGIHIKESLLKLEGALV